MSKRLNEIASSIARIPEAVQTGGERPENAAIRAGRFLLEALDRHGLGDLPPWRGEIYHTIKAAESGDFLDQHPPNYRGPGPPSPSPPVHAWIMAVNLLVKQAGGPPFGPMFRPGGTIDDRFILEGCPLVARAIQEAVRKPSVRTTAAVHDNGTPITELRQRKGGRPPIDLADAKMRRDFGTEVIKRKKKKTPMKVVAEEWGIPEEEGRVWMKWYNDNQKT